MTTIKEFAKYINRAHGDGFDNVEIPIEKARELLSKLEIAEKGLEYISGFHVRGSADKELQILRDKASEFLLQVRE